ncbi:hypothetical protein [Sphingomonas sp.]|uniref:head-tail connector protein n=1 Tax=Sphingomonas sp. TaxID=28214 RepID=UPI001B0BD82A|nr:hypothetical protein [Sphingomonas sp.]MBO9712960.1 hypothetical protein [Sphingomonas sp.]
MDAPAFPGAAIAAAREAAKAYLRIAGDSEDDLIDTLAASALGLGEAFTGSAWIARAWVDLLPVSACWQQLGVAPVTAITAVEGVAADGAAALLAADGFAIDIDAEGQGWVRVMVPGDARRVRVTLGAGAAAGWGDLPPPLRQGAVLLVAHLFEHRDADAAPPAAVSALWRPFRRLRLAEGEHAA